MRRGIGSGAPVQSASEPLRGVAQLAEHRSPKPGVAGSSPAAPVGLVERKVSQLRGVSALPAPLLQLLETAGNRWTREPTGAQLARSESRLRVSFGTPALSDKREPERLSRVAVRGFPAHECRTLAHGSLRARKRSPLSALGVDSSSKVAACRGVHQAIESSERRGRTGRTSHSRRERRIGGRDRAWHSRSARPRLFLCLRQPWSWAVRSSPPRNRLCGSVCPGPQAWLVLLDRLLPGQPIPPDSENEARPSRVGAASAAGSAQERHAPRLPFSATGREGRARTSHRPSGRVYSGVYSGKTSAICPASVT